LETLEEIAIENRQVFLNAGGEQYRYIPALNDAPGHLRTLTELIEQQAGGWPEFGTGGETAAECAERRQRALALGATT
jgi:ferrochelatase